MATLSPADLLFLQDIRNKTFDEFKLSYQGDPSDNLATQYYGRIADAGINYGDLALGVVRNDSEEGIVANAYSGKIAADQAVPIDLSVGSNDWLQAQYEILTRDFDRRQGKNGDDLIWEEVRDVHTEAFNELGLPAKAWTPFVPLEQVERADPALADAVWEDLTESEGFFDFLFAGEAAAGLAVLNAGDFSDALGEIAGWMADLTAAADDLTAAALLELLPPEDFPNFWNAAAAANEAIGDLLDFLGSLPIPNPFDRPEAPGAITGQGQGENVRQVLDPLAIDLDGDGQISLTTGDTVYFDIDADGIKEAVSWVGAEDGWLVRDVNANGTIDDINELFGNETETGFAELAALDSNADGKITAADTAYDELQVWQDSNQDGIAQTSELLSVKDDLFLVELPVVDTPEGSNTATVNAAIGDVHIEDVFLEMNGLNTIAGGDTDITFSAALLPEIRGYGDVTNLSIAITRDATLLAEAEALAGQTLTDIASNFGAFSASFDNMLYRWAGVQDINVDSRGPFMSDARKLEFLETFLDFEFTQLRSGGSNIPLSIPAEGLERVYTDVKSLSMGRFLMQTVADELYNESAIYNANLDRIVFDGTPTLNATTLNDLGTFGATAPDAAEFWAAITSIIDATINPTATRAGQGLNSLTAADEAALNTAIQLSDPALDWATIEDDFMSFLPMPEIVAGADDDILTGTTGDDTIDGGAGNDEISGLDGNDVLTGGDGNDTLIGGDGADRLIGGDGNDTLRPGNDGSLLEGGLGNDTYKYAFGVSDYIVDEGGTSDVADLGIGSSGFELLRTADDDGNYVDLTFRTGFGFGDPLDLEVVIQDQFNPNNPDAVIEQIINGSSQILELQADGSYMTSFSGPVIETLGTDGNDVITNLDVDFVDTLGQLITGTGEIVDGGLGDDVITMNHLNSSQGMSHVGTGGGGDNTITVIGDASATNTTEFNQNREISINGGNGNDTMIAVSGVHTLSGGSGDDTYIWQGGDIIVIDTNSGSFLNDSIVIDQGNISLSDLQFVSGGSLLDEFGVVNISINGSDNIMDIRFQDSANAPIDFLSITAAANMPDISFLSYSTAWAVGTSGDDVLGGEIVAVGMDGNDTITDTTGDDILAGGRGDDTLTSNGGNDYLDGGEGADTFVYNTPGMVFDPIEMTYSNPVEMSYVVGGKDADHLDIHLFSTQTNDNTAIINDLLLLQNHIAANLDLTALHGDSFTLGTLGLTVSDIETFKVFLDGIEDPSFLPTINNTDPVAQDDVFALTEGETLAGNVLNDNGNGVDSDPDAGQVLSVAPATIATANGGSVELNADGSFTYDPNGFVGADSFDYTVQDGFGGTDTGTVNLTVNEAPNINPVAVDDIIDADGMDGFSGNVLQDNGHNGFGVDYDLDRDTLNVVEETVTTAEGGMVMIYANGDFMYNAAVGFEGDDSFTYTVQDGLGGSDIGTVNISNIATDPFGVIIGTEGDDTIVGTVDNDDIFGLGGNDSIDGAAGDDTMTGGTGDDTYFVDSANDIVVENLNEGNDTVISSVDRTLSDNVENLTLTGTAINGTGNDLDNVLVGNLQNNVLDGGLGVDTVDLSTATNGYVANLNTGSAIGNGFDTFVNIENIIGSDMVDTFYGDDNVNDFRGGLGGDSLYGGGNDDFLYGEVDGDLLSGDAGDDLLEGGDGNDFLTGGTGTDTLKGQDGDDYIIGDGGDTLEGGIGNDSYILNSTTDTIIENAGEGIDAISSTVSQDLNNYANVENLTLTGTGNIDGTGDSGDNVLTGNSGDNTLTGGAGNDTLSGKAGSNTLIGGTGDDTYIVETATDVITENTSEGIDTVEASVSYTLSSNVENITLTGSSDINATGNAGDNTLVGNLGSNVLDGGAGIDTVDLSTATNGYVANLNTGAAIGNGFDTFTNIENIIGSDLVDTLTGDTNANTFHGGLGNDTLHGSGGDDSLFGEDGGDYLTGGLGNDYLDGGAGNDFIQGGADNDTILSGDGLDYMMGEAGADTFVFDDTALNDNDVVLDFSTAQGDAIDISQVITSYDSAVHTLTDFVQITDNGTNSFLSVDLDGTGTTYSMQQILTMNGVTGLTDEAALVSSGNLIVESGMAMMMGGGGGSSSMMAAPMMLMSGVSMTAVTSGMAAPLVDIDTYTGDDNANILHGDATNDTLIGKDGNDFLDGEGGSDFLDGGAGNDKLVGNGNDTLKGGSGDDIYVVNSASNTIVENAGEGIDTISSSVSQVLSNYANVENVTLTGTSNINAYGDANDNVLTGNAGNNMLVGGVGNDTLNGEAGADTLHGGAGDDLYIVRDAGDTIIEAANAGTDTVHTSVSMTLADNVENVVLTGADSINLTANASDNHITVNAGNNTIDGGAGTDTIDYSASDAAFFVNLAAGMAVGDSFDSISNVENIIGTALNDTLMGDAGDNQLNGGAGDDILIGGEGADTFALTDINGIDTIAGFSTTEGDVIDISDVISTYDPANDAIADFVEITQVGNNTIVSVDTDGSANGSVFTQIATLQDVTGITDEAAMVAAGHLVVNG